MSATTHAPASSQPDLEALRAGLRGAVIVPGDPACDEARTACNGMMDRHPAAIVRCTETADVAAAVSYARAHGLPLAVRCGSHSTPGYSTRDGGVVIDLRPMNAVQVDARARIARVQGGSVWAELDVATQEHGLAVTGGRVDTGVPGLTLGSGWLERMSGFTPGNLISAEVVTADANVVRASAEENPELFWGLRDGGRNFGVVTQFAFALHPTGDGPPTGSRSTRGSSSSSAAETPTTGSAPTTTFRWGRKMFRHVGRSFALGAALLTVTAGTAVAAVGLGTVTRFKAQFSTPSTSAPSGLVLLTNGNPPRTGISEAPFVRETVILPVGSTLRLGALPQCRASDARLASLGAERACPARSRVGNGSADGVDSGLAVRFDIGIYAVRGRLVFAAEQGGKPLKRYFVGVAHGANLVLTIPTLGGAIIPTGFSAQIGARPRAQVWLRTPPSCPQPGHWTVTGTFQGVSSAGPGAHPLTAAQHVVGHVACTR